MFSQPPRHEVADVIVTPFGKHGPAAALNTATAPSSGTIDRAYFYPMRFWDPFTVALAGWTNGATASTDSVDIGCYRMTDLSTGRLDLIRSTGAILASGANAVQSTGTWKVARANLTSGGDSTDQDTYTTASVTLKAGRLYCLAVENSHASSAPAVSSVTGGPTWASRASVQYNGTANRISLWTGVPTVDYTGTIAIFFGSSSGNTGACWALDEMSGVDTTTNHGIVQTATGTGSSVTPAATLAAFGSANNATYGVQGKAANATSAPGSGFTELTDVGTATPAQSISTEWRVDNDTSVDFTISSAAWGCLAAEIKADASPFVIPAGNDLYMGLAVSGTTTTFFRVSTIAHIVSSGVLQAATTFPLPSNITPSGAAINIGRTVIAGFSSRNLW